VVADVAVQDDAALAQRTLEESARLNPFVAEPHVLLAQLHLNAGRWDEALAEASRALELQVQWATPWDKRLGWEAWVAWTRVMLKASREHDWPSDGMGIISLGEVRPGH
jgi:tetratricopeptide (TPR) repeat protein